MSTDGKVRQSGKRVKTGGGSRKGIPNKNTAEVKDMILGALQDVGGQEYLSKQARENPNGFMNLIGKVIPKEVKAEVTGSLELILAQRLKDARERIK